MSAFNTIQLVKLHNLAKSAKFDGHGDKTVRISGRTKHNHDLVQMYRDICAIFNRQRPMTWAGLYHLLHSKLKDEVMVLE
jgi:Protein of unknown function (DUF1031).